MLINYCTKKYKDLKCPTLQASCRFLQLKKKPHYFLFGQLANLHVTFRDCFKAFGLNFIQKPVCMEAKKDNLTNSIQIFRGFPEYFDSVT